MCLCTWQNARLAIDQSSQFGADFEGCYRASDVANIIKLLKHKGSATILMPIVTCRNHLYQGLEELLGLLNSPDVHLVFDEVHELVNTSKLANAVEKLRNRYLREKRKKVRVSAVSATPPPIGCKITEKLFGAPFKVLTMPPDETESLLNSINEQHCLSRKTQTTFELENSTDSGTKELREQLCTMVVGNALFPKSKNINQTTGLKRVQGELLANQLHGKNRNGGILFEETPAGKVQMQKKNGDAWEDVEVYPTLVVAHSDPQGAETHLKLLQDLQKETEDVRLFKAFDLRSISYIDSAQRDKALKQFEEAFKEQKIINIAIIDKSSTSGSRDFSKNVHFAVAVGTWKACELKQFMERMGRAVQMVDGDCVPKEFTCMHFDSKFSSKLLKMPTSCLEQALPEELLSDHEDKVLNELKLPKLEKRKCEDAILHLKSLKLTPDPVVKYLECIKNQAVKEKFKEEEYLPLFSHIEGPNGCTKAAMNVYSCCDECKNVFKNKDEDEDDDEEEDDVEGEDGDLTKAEDGDTVI